MTWLRLMVRCPTTGVLTPSGHAKRPDAEWLGGGTVSVLCAGCGESHRVPMTELIPEPEDKSA